MGNNLVGLAMSVVALTPIWIGAFQLIWSDLKDWFQKDSED